MFFVDEEEYEPIPRGAKVELLPYKQKPTKPYTLMTQFEIYKYKGGIALFDVEVFPNYFLVSFKLLNQDKYIQFELSPDTAFDPKMLSWVMHNYTTVGFNSHHFDIPITWLAYLRQNNAYLSQMAQAIIDHDLRRFQIEELGKFQCFPTKTIDLIEVAPLKGSLKTYGGRLHAERMQDLPYDPRQPLTREQAAIVKAYNINDLLVTELMANNLEEELNLRRQLSTDYGQDLMSKSDAQIAEYVISNEIAKKTGKRPVKPSKSVGQVHQYRPPEWMRFTTPIMKHVFQTVCNSHYVVTGSGKVEVPDAIKNLDIRIGSSVYRMGNGGLHSSEKEVSVKAGDGIRILDRDVASYYPFIILNQNLKPEHLGDDFTEVYKTIVERRIAAKKAKNDAVANSLKITINGSFGKFGSPWSILYAPDLLIQVTVSGQLCLLMLIEMLEVEGIEVVSANTDGIVMKVKDSQHNVYADTIARWENITGFTTEETEYSSVYSRDVNAYLAIKPPEGDKPASTKGKNVYFNPWDAGKKFSIFRFHKNPTATVCIKAIELLIINGTPVEETIKAETDIKRFIVVKNVRGGGHKNREYLGKVVRWYYAKNEVGCINYVIGNKKVSESDGAKPCMDLPTTLPDDIDYDAYIRRAHTLLENMGYYQRVKDVSFF